MLQFGWKAGAEQYPPVALLEQAETAESVGFDCIDISDHFHPWSEEGQASFAWTWLGAAAVKTTRIHIGTGVTCPILRYHPSIVAQAAATVACFAPGRTFLAVGTGEALNEYSATGEWPAYQARQDRMIEAIEMIRALWTGERVTHHGVYYRTQQAKLYTPPPAPIPLYVSALVPNSAAVAGRYGDGLITVGGHPPHVYRSLLERFEVGAREAGKDPARLPRMVELNVSYANDERAALASLKAYWAGTFIPALFSERIYTPTDVRGKRSSGRERHDAGNWLHLEQSGCPRRVRATVYRARIHPPDLPFGRSGPRRVSPRLRRGRAATTPSADVACANAPVTTIA